MKSIGLVEKSLEKEALSIAMAYHLSVYRLWSQRRQPWPYNYNCIHTVMFIDM